MSTEALTHLRDEFRRAFQEYLREGDRMAELLRGSADHLTPERQLQLRDQQAVLTAALRRYETARQEYVEAVMGEFAGFSAMGLRVQ
jgi:hypothetical protein